MPWIAGLLLAARLITVTVRGVVVRDPGRPVSPELDDLAVDGQSSRRRPRRILALHKPRGYVTTRVDPEGRPSVYTLLPADGDDLQAVGRLDRATTGLLLFTNDTQLAHRLTDPARGVPRTYVVTVRGALPDATLAGNDSNLSGWTRHQLMVPRLSALGDKRQGVEFGSIWSMSPVKRRRAPGGDDRRSAPLLELIAKSVNAKAPKQRGESVRLPSSRLPDLENDRVKDSAY